MIRFGYSCIAIFVFGFLIKSGNISVIANDTLPDVKAVDDDFALQGEYVGQRCTLHGWRRSGLQVVALGDGQFSARAYAGGLPGDGADLGQVTTFTGERHGPRLVLRARSGERIELSAEESSNINSGCHTNPTWAKVHRRSATLALRPPRNARLLFAQGQSSSWLDPVRQAEDGSLLAGTATTFPVGDFYMHLEFRTPYMPDMRGQERGNSGVYVQRRYEVQILDSFGLEGKADECGGLYKQRAPEQNMCFPPLAWQTYDIYFTAARWDSDGRKLKDAVITVYHNGVAVHYRQPVVNKTGAGQAETPQPLPILLQDHRDPVTFRNVWIVAGGQQERT
jgi:hypothetical protein